MKRKKRIELARKHDKSNFCNINYFGFVLLLLLLLLLGTINNNNNKRKYTKLFPDQFLSILYFTETLCHYTSVVMFIMHMLCVCTLEAQN